MKGSVIYMANIQWTSSSINSFFQTSLNQKNSTGFNSMYSLLGDASLIRSGGYYKLMDAYYKEVKAQNTASTKTEKTQSSNKKTDETKTKETKDTSKTTDTSTDTKKATSSYVSYNSSGTKTQTSASTLDTSI